MSRLAAADSSASVWFALGASVLVAAVGLAWWPWATSGAAVGLALVLGTLRWPRVVVGVLLFLGPLNLAFVTGGSKSLFAGLGGLDMNGIRLVGVTGGLGLMLLADRRYWPELTVRRAAVYVAFLVYAGATILLSIDPIEGARLLFKLAWPLLFYLVATRCSPQQIDRMLDAVLLGAAVLIMVNPLFVLGGGVITEQSGDVRVQGAGIHQNPFSFYLLVVVLVSLARFGSRGQARYVLLAMGALFWMALTLTRITLLAGLVALAVAGAYGAVVRGLYRQLVGALIVAGVIAVAMVPLMLTRTFGYVPGPGALVALAGDPVALYQQVNWQGREVFWGVLVVSWMGSPWIGIGLGSSSGILKSLFTVEMGQVAHNEYIRLGTDTGIVGLTLFGIAMVLWGLAVVRSGRRGGAAVGEVALPALALLFAWAVISITDNAFDYYAAYTQYVGFLVGATVALLRPPAMGGGDV